MTAASVPEPALSRAADRERSAAFVPELYVSDFRRSLEFYVDLVGFEVRYERPESQFAYLALGEAELMIEHDATTWVVAPLERPYGRGINFQIAVSDLDALYARFVASGHGIVAPPEERWYRRGSEQVGQKQFLVQDPDGYLLRFAQFLAVR